MSNVVVSEINGLKIYNLSSGKTFYEMLKDSKFSHKQLRKNEDYVNRIEIIQEFEFPVSSQCIQISEDGNYIVASGIYPPRIKIYDLNEMTLKVERGLDSEVRKLQMLSTDYSKLAVLCEDRNIEVHAQYGKHFKIRIPKYGRDLTYHKHTCDLFAVGSSNEVYRLNLYKGQFMQPFISKSNEINACSVNNHLDLLATAGLNGIVELYDLRSKEKASELPVLNHSSFKNYDFSDVTAIEFSPDGMNLATGNKEGKVYMYDLRYPVPLFNIKHSYKLPIKKIKFHEFSKNIITIDKKIAKYSNMKTGKSYTNIETKNEINDFDCFEKSGLSVFSCEEEKMQIYFIPSVGPAPAFCSFLENITEELEETKEYNVYEDFKFLTLNDLQQISATGFIGTKFIKSYLNGYLMDWKLYNKLKALSDPFAYDKFLEERKKEKMKQLLGDRIVVNRNKHVKVNKQLADNIKTEENKEVMKDNRFSKLFTDKNYEIDYNSEIFAKKMKKTKSNDDEKTDFLNEKDNSSEEDAVNKKIVNPNLFKLQEKLISKKRKKIDSLFGNNEDELEETIEEKLKNKSNEKDDEEDFDLVTKIKKFESKERRLNNKLDKKKKIDNKLKDKRILADTKRLSNLKLK